MRLGDRQYNLNEEDERQPLLIDFARDASLNLRVLTCARADAGYLEPAQSGSSSSSASSQQGRQQSQDAFVTLQGPQGSSIRQPRSLSLSRTQLAGLMCETALRELAESAAFRANQLADVEKLVDLALVRR